MLSKQQNERLTRVGPGTPCGELLRRYWQPLCPAAELTAERPKKRLRVMCEDLVVFKDPAGGYGCVAEACPHRGVSLYYGFLEEGGIRCAYHGWRFDCEGRCTEQPFERNPRFKDNIRIAAYPVRKLAGLLFVYMGPDPAKAPLLPRWDVMVREDGRRTIQIRPPLACNWLQCQENTVDITHTYYLHGHMSAVLGLDLPSAAYYHRPIENYRWKVCEWGIEKMLVYGGDQPEIEIRPPLIFPNILCIPAGAIESIHWRVPIDDTNTRIVWIGFLPSRDGSPGMREDEDPSYEYLTEERTPEGDFMLQDFNSHDSMAWQTQGPVFDRSVEHLGATDEGIVMLRRMLEEQIARVERGEDPTVAVVRDPEQNRMIGFPSKTIPTGGDHNIARWFGDKALSERG
jgi:5,5'-dehydrodivanillate O-demethylase